MLLIGMKNIEQDNLISLYQTAMNINNSRIQQPLNDKVQDNITTIVGRNKATDKDFFSFLFPQNQDEYNNIPNFVFENLFENKYIYKYYKKIFKNKLINNQSPEVLRSYLWSKNIEDKISYELYTLGKNFFKTIIIIKASDANKFIDLKNLSKSYRLFLNKILTEQSHLLTFIKKNMTMKF